MGAYFGIDGVCTFDTGYTEVGNLALSFDVDLSSAVQAEVSYWSYEQTECGGENCGWDHRYVQYSTDGGGTWYSEDAGGPEDEWRNPSFGLPAGAPLRVRFQFDTINTILNEYFGWMVDDVEIRGCFPSDEPVFATHVRAIPLPVPGYLLGLVRAATGDGSTPVPGATVEVNWTIPPGSHVLPQMQTTNANGLTFPVMLLNWPGTYTLDLVNITAAGYAYDPDMNWESSASYTLP